MRKKLQLLLYLIPVLALVACSQNDGTPDEPDVQETRVPARKIKLTRAQEEIRDAQTDFAFKYAQNMTICSQEFQLQNKENWVVSPFSRFVNLSMLANGANEEVYHEFRNVLQFPKDATLNDINEYNRMMLGEMFTLDKDNVDFNIATSIWLNEKCTLVDKFNEVTTEFYNTPVNVVSFEESEGQPNQVNQWLSQNCPGMDFNLKLLQFESSVILGTMNFDGKWSQPFDKSKTKKAFFKNHNTTSVYTDFMSRNSTGIYGEDDNCRMTSLSYGNWAFDFYIFLPKGDLNEFVSRFTPEEFEYLKETAISPEVRLQMPKFNYYSVIQPTSSFDDLGFIELAKLTDDNLFSNFYTNPIKQEYGGSLFNNLYISMSVGEDGCKVVSAEVTKPNTNEHWVIAPAPAEIVDFVVDRPFYFMIAERSTGVIILSGAIHEIEE